MSEHRPALRVIRGDATDEEIAALLAVMAVRGGGDAGSASNRPTSAWMERSALVRHPVHPGPGAWRASAWPR